MGEALRPEDPSPTSAQAATTAKADSGELATDDPAVNFRVTGFTDTSAAVQWEAPGNRGIRNHVPQRFEHDGSDYESTAGWTIDGDANGGGSSAWANTTLEPDTLYKYVLMLKDAQATTVIEASVTVRTLTTGGPTLSNDASLRALTVSGIDELGPLPFSSGFTYYTASVAHSVTQTTVSATPSHSGASYQVKLGGAVDADGVIPLSESRNNISVVVTAEDQATTRIYTVIVTREGLFSTDARLSDLTLSNFGFGTFDSGTTQYTARVVGVPETTVTPTLNHSGASHEITLNGVVDADGVIPLAVGSNAIAIEVTAEDGSTTLTYTVTVTRLQSADATLRDLALSDAELAFGRLTTEYRAQVANDVTETTVTAQAEQSGGEP